MNLKLSLSLSLTKPIPLIASLLLTSCFTGQQSSTEQAIRGAAQSKSPVVEAFVEYVGPNEKWAGPASYILHVIAKDPGIVQVQVTPGATAEANSRKVASVKAVSVEVARTEMLALANQIHESEVDEKGCTSLVRVRMIRMDGTTFEKQGCRSSVGWVGAVSLFTSIYAAFGS